MSLISLSRVSYSVETRTVFQDLSFAIRPGERVALVGLNGAGKSTLLRLIAGELEPDSGIVARSTGAGIEYVPQVLPEGLRDVALFEAFIERVPEAMRFHGFEHLIEQRLSAAGFTPEHYNQKLGTFSGGEVNRALVARALVSEPDLLLLDEPTNHMDIEQVAIFERFSREELHAALLIVSHDRALLDAVTSRTLFLREGSIVSFNLPFSEARDALHEADRAAYERRHNEERELERLRASAHRLAEWGKNSGNEKFSARAQSMHKRIEKLSKEVAEVPVTRRAKVALEATTSQSPVIIDIAGLLLTIPDGRTLATIDRLAVRRGERLAIVGRNGCGKSTLIRSVVSTRISGARSPYIGYNPSLTIGYYDQELAHFKPEERIAEAVSARCALPSHRITAELINAGFEYARHRQRIAILSGGEKARLTFLILSLARPQLLILDEPTNHLDVDGIEQLEESLVSGGGTVIFVSHDRRFLERVATRVFEMPHVKEV